MNAEIWYGLTNLQLLTQRDGISCVVATMQSTDFSEVEAFAATRLDLLDDRARDHVAVPDRRNADWHG